MPRISRGALKRPCPLRYEDMEMEHKAHQSPAASEQERATMHIHQLDAEVLYAGRSELVQQIYHAATLPPNAMLAATSQQMTEFLDPVCASYQHF